MVILEKTVEIDTESPETLDEEPKSVQKPEIPEKPESVQEPESAQSDKPEPKKRGRPKKNVPKEPKPRGRPPKPPPAPVPSPVPSPAPSPAFDMDMYNQHLLRALMDHSRTSILRKEERWRNLVKF